MLLSSSEHIGDAEEVHLHNVQTPNEQAASVPDEPCDGTTADRSSDDRAVICVSVRSSSQDRPAF